MALTKKNNCANHGKSTILYGVFGSIGRVALINQDYQILWCYEIFSTLASKIDFCIPLIFL